MFIDPDVIPSTGSGVLDAAHARLAQVVNEAYDEWREKGQTDVLRETFQYFQKMAERHFLQEEHIIRSAGFEGWREHRETHVRILKDLNQLLEQLDAGNWASQDVIEAFKAVDSLIYEHECSEDQDFWSVVARQRSDFALMEPLIGWSDAYSVGIMDIDKDHAALVRLVNRIHIDTVAGAGPRRIETGLEALRTRARSHFVAEEALMNMYGVPTLGIHRVLHENLEHELDRIIEAHRKKGFCDVDAALQRRLKVWLVDHIVNVDRDIARHIFETASGFGDKV